LWDPSEPQRYFAKKKDGGRPFTPYKFTYSHEDNIYSIDGKGQKEDREKLLTEDVNPTFIWQKDKGKSKIEITEIEREVMENDKVVKKKETVLAIQNSDYEEYNFTTRERRNMDQDAGCGFHGSWDTWYTLTSAELNRIKDLDVDSIVDIRPIGYIESWRNLISAASAKALSKLHMIKG